MKLSDLLDSDDMNARTAGAIVVRASLNGWSRDRIRKSLEEGIRWTVPAIDSFDLHVEDEREVVAHIRKFLISMLPSIEHDRWEVMS